MISCSLPVRAALLSCALALAGCNAGSSSLAPASLITPAASSGGGASATVSIMVPPRGADRRRFPSYISPATTQIRLSAASAGVSGAPSLSLTAPCTATACTLTMAGLPTGAVQFSATLLDVNSNILSGGSTTVTLVAGPNTVNFAVGGSIASLVMTANPIGFSPGTAGSGTLSAVAKDASGTVITGTAPYFNPISIVNSDTTGVVSLSSTTIISPGTPLAVNYNGALTVTGARLTAIVQGVSPAMVVNAGILVRNIYAVSLGAGEVRIFKPSGVPAAFDPIAGLSGPNAIAIDSNDNVFIGDSLKVRSYPPGSNVFTNSFGTSSSVTSLVIDGANNLYEQESTPTGQVNEWNAASAFALGAPTFSFLSGATNQRWNSVTPGGSYNVVDYGGGPGTVTSFNFHSSSYTRRITLASGQATASNLDSLGNMCVSAQLPDSVRLYTGSPSTTAYATISSGLNNAKFCAFDSAGNVYVANYSGDSVTAYTPAGVGPTMTYTTGNGPSWIAFDPAGYMWVANLNAPSIMVFQVGNPTPFLTITNAPLNSVQNIAFGR